MKYKVKVTEKQRRAVDNIVTGKFKTAPPAMRDAGYTLESSKEPDKNLFSRRGVELYLKTLSKVCKNRFNLSLQDKVMTTYLDGLEATKLYGKNAIEHPDTMARIASADRFAEFFGWKRGVVPTASQQFNQFNFFSIDQEEQKRFNDNFKNMLGKYYEDQIDVASGK